MLNRTVERENREEEMAAGTPCDSPCHNQAKDETPRIFKEQMLNGASKHKLLLHIFVASSINGPLALKS